MNDQPQEEITGEELLDRYASSLWPHPVHTVIHTLIDSGWGDEEVVFDIEGVCFRTALAAATHAAISHAGYPIGAWTAHPGAHRVHIPVEARITRASVELRILPRNDDELLTVCGADLAPGDVVIHASHLLYGRVLPPAGDPLRIERFEADARHRRCRRRMWVKCLRDGRTASVTVRDERSFFIFGPTLLRQVEGR